MTLRYFSAHARSYLSNSAKWLRSWASVLACPVSYKMCLFVIVCIASHVLMQRVICVFDS